MACDFTIASDFAVFGQAGPKHGSSPIGGSTDFLPVFVGAERAMWSATLCEMWSAYQAVQVGLITEAVPVLKVDGEWVPNPTVETDRWVDRGQIVFGQRKHGEALAAGKELVARGAIDLGLLDEAVEACVTRMLMMFPNCLEHTVLQVRKHKLQHWDKNKESSRAWLALNMMTEANAGFRAFNDGARGDREINFVGLRQRLARGETWGEDLIQAVMPRSATKPSKGG